MSVIRFLAIKMLSVPTKRAYGREMQKNLNEGELYRFFDGVEINEDEIIVPPEFKLYDAKCVNRPISINISAIVGENGAGKSTLIDYVLRILNNLATYILGEPYRLPGAEHLHYVFDVYAQLFVQVGNRVFEIHCEGDVLIVYQHIKNNLHPLIYTRDTAYPLIKERFSTSDIIQEHMNLRDILGDFCYTIIVNYSLYSLCTVNFKNENTLYKKENEIRRQGLKDGYETKTLDVLRNDAKNKRGSMLSYYDAQSWLQGLFVKNDGYQMPVVISPMRTYGRIDVQKEYKLAKERMLSLVFMRNEYGKHQFCRLNGKLLIDGITISKDVAEEQKNSNIDWIKDYLSPLERRLQMDIVGTIRQSIISHCDIQENKRDHSELVWNYIVKKILKIIFTYPRYIRKRDVLLSLSSTHMMLSEIIDSIVLDILHDHSHITRKLFRSIYYLKYEHINKRKSLRIEDFGVVISQLLKEEKDKSPMCPQYIDELLPPPVFHIDFDLYDVSDIQKCHKIKFSSLSSGEKQITYTLSSFFYQLTNIDSSGDIREKHNNKFSLVNKIDVQDGNNNPITYKYVCAIFDEIELYYHPEMQRLFVQTLIDGLKQLEFRQIEGLHIIMATHSPFILSDIPVQNVMFLGKDGLTTRMDDFCTFGANIHSMLKHSFFLEDGTMGEFARNTIRSAQNTINRYLIWHELIEIMDDLYMKDERIEYLRDCKRKQLYSLPNGIFEQWLSGDDNYEKTNECEDLQWVSGIIDIIQEPIIKKVMIEQLKKWQSYVAFRN